MWKIISKRKITISIYFTSNSRVLKINKNIYHNEVIWWLTCQFQADFPLLNPLIISENQRFRISDVFNGYRREKLAWNGFLKKLLLWEIISLWLTMIEFYLRETSNQLIYNESCQLLLRTFFFGFHKFWLQIAQSSKSSYYCIYMLYHFDWYGFANFLLPLFI